jgi:hypothetical protein
MRLRNMEKIEWIDPWEQIENGGPDLVTELQKELPLQHVLYGLKVSAIAHRIDCDDVLFQVDDGSFAIVHLTWSGKQDKNVKFPWTIKYSDIDEFIKKALIPDAKEYGSIA